MRKKADRSELSFLFLWVVNPLVILFYQNCSSIPSASGTLNPPPAPTKIVEHSKSSTSLNDCLQKDVSGECMNVSAKE